MFGILFIIISIVAMTRAADLTNLPGCVQPPLECPNENITYWLYTRSNRDNPHQIFTMDDDSIRTAPWVTDAPVKILIHGYTGHKDFSPNPEIRPAYMELYDYNIISIDYNPLVREPCYFQAAANTELVGKCTAELICTLVEKHGFSLPRFHVVGFSLGGQTAGFIGDYMTCGRLTRITGLDPALPLFASNSNSRKLDASDAQFVDILHTNALEKGKLESCGHLDFYANGGLTQPGCLANENQTKSGCDHARAPAYFAESITTQVGFYATRCFSWIAYMIGWCELTDSADEILYGENVPYGSEGMWFFRTNSKSPYARGSNKNGYSNSQNDSRITRNALDDWPVGENEWLYDEDYNQIEE